MLNYIEPTQGSTIVPLALLSQSQSQQQTTDPVASLLSYAIGSIASTHVQHLHIQLSEGDTCPLLLPRYVPPSILATAAFQDGYEYNYLSEEEMAEEADVWATSVPRLVNYIYTTLTDDCYYRDLETGKAMPEFLPWQVGWLLRDLTRLVETDRPLGLRGDGPSALCAVAAHPRASGRLAPL
ncbi:MAG TPA: hypothetical protein VJ761_21355 [Ktedonobacteraceae bacterium]|nr:hypothetical protein [Ktedonobacteraceae bacterium]